MNDPDEQACEVLNILQTHHPDDLYSTEIQRAQRFNSSLYKEILVKTFDNISQRSPEIIAIALLELIKISHGSTGTDEQETLLQTARDILTHNHLNQDPDVLRACSQVVLYGKNENERKKENLSPAEQSTLQTILLQALHAVRNAEKPLDHPMGPLIRELGPYGNEGYHQVAATLLDRINGIAFFPDQLSSLTLRQDAKTLFSTCRPDKLDQQMNLIWQDPHYQVLILLQVHTQNPEILSALIGDKDNITFENGLVSSSLKTTENPTHHQYIIAAYLNLALVRGTLPKLGNITEPTEKVRQAIMAELATCNASETETDLIITLKTDTLPKPAREIHEIDPKYCIKEDFYNSYAATLAALQVDPTKTLTKDDLETILTTASQELDPLVLRNLAYVAHREDGLVGGELQQPPLRTRLSHAEVADFIKKSCAALNLQDEKEKDNFAAYWAEQMGYDKEKRFNRNDHTTFVRPEHRKNHIQAMKSHNMRWVSEAPATPAFTQTTVETLYTFLFNENGEPKSSQFQETTAQVAEQLHYNPKTFNLYGHGGQHRKNRIGKTQSFALAKLADDYQQNGILTLAEIATLYATIEGGGGLET